MPRNFACKIQLHEQHTHFARAKLGCARQFVDVHGVRSKSGQNAIAVVSSVREWLSDSSVVALGALKTGEGKPAPIVAPVTGAIKPGSYRVMWRVTGDDGHPISGNYVFTVKPKSAN